MRKSLLALLLGTLAWPLVAEDLCDIEYKILLYHPIEQNKEVEDDGSSDIIRVRIVDAIQESMRRTLLNYYALPVVESPQQTQLPEIEEDNKEQFYLVVIPIISQLRISETSDTSNEPIDATTDQQVQGRYSINLNLALELREGIDATSDERQEIRLSLADTPDGEISQQIVNRLSEEINTLLLTAEGEISRGRVLYVDGDLIFASLGDDDGLRLGDELLSPTSLLRPECQIVGSDTIGLFKVVEINEEVSIAQRIIGTHNPVNGQPVILDRRNVALEPYISTLVDTSFRSALLTAGVRIYPLTGLFLIRPFGALEVAVPLGRSATLFPLHLYGGIELNWYIGPLLFSPRIGTGVALGLGFNSGETFFSTHVGVIGSLTTSIWLTRDLGLSIDLGYGYWFGVYNSLVGIPSFANFDLIQGYGGVLVGVGLRIKL